MKIYEIKSKKVFAVPDGYVYIAEAEVEEADGSETFVAIQKYNGLDMTVSKQSMYDFLCGEGADPAEEFLEEYKEADTAAIRSSYAKVFAKLMNVIEMLEVVE